VAERANVCAEIKRMPMFREDGRERFRDQRGSVEKAVDDTRVYTGLCKNCAKRDTCKIPKSEGGVWHCKHYVEAR
jgi:hypothetical protein